MKIVGVQYHTGEGVFAGKEYNYYTEVDLKPGDVIKVPVGKSKITARVSRIDVDECEISEKILPYMRTITDKEIPD